MSTRQQIIDIANELIVERGFNAFSYKTISERIKIKTSSIHYYFPTKTDLGIGILDFHKNQLQNSIESYAHLEPKLKLQKLISHYKNLSKENKVCIVGAFSSDVDTLDEDLRLEIISYSSQVLAWTSEIIKEGIEKKQFHSKVKPRVKAIQIITQMMALLQISRMEKSNKNFEAMTRYIIEELTIVEK